MFDKEDEGKSYGGAEKMRTMLEYVAEEGYALKSVPWFIDQTVGGALRRVRRVVVSFWFVVAATRVCERCSAEPWKRFRKERMGGMLWTRFGVT